MKSDSLNYKREGGSLMKFKRLFIFLSFFLIGCFDMFDQSETKIYEDIYAIHSAGINGYSIVKKISKNGSIPIIHECIVEANWDNDYNKMIVKSIPSFNSIDTMYFHYSFAKKKLDTISISAFYKLKLECKNEKVFLSSKK